MFENKVLSLSSDQRVNLPAIIKRAKEQNFPGMKFTSKPAYFFTKDCVDISEDYIALVIYSTIEDPIMKLKGKVTKAEVSTFVKKTTPEAWALLKLILFDIQKTGVEIAAVAPPETTVPETTASAPADDGDIYGVYGMVDGSVDAVLETEPVQEEVVIKHDVSSTDAIIATLNEVLEAT